MTNLGPKEAGNKFLLAATQDEMTATTQQETTT
jgi:hypothetical protein